MAWRVFFSFTEMFALANVTLADKVQLVCHDQTWPNKLTYGLFYGFNVALSKSQVLCR